MPPLNNVKLFANRGWSGHLKIKPVCQILRNVQVMMFSIIQPRKLVLDVLKAHIQICKLSHVMLVPMEPLITTWPSCAIWWIAVPSNTSAQNPPNVWQSHHALQANTSQFQNNRAWTSPHVQRVSCWTRLPTDASPCPSVPRASNSTRQQVLARTSSTWHHPRLPTWFMVTTSPSTSNSTTRQNSRILD